MNELTSVLQKEQEQKEKIEKAKEEADLAIHNKKAQLEKKLEGVSLGEKEITQMKVMKEKKLQEIENVYQAKTAQALERLSKIKKEKLSKAADYLVEKILCLK